MIEEVGVDKEGSKRILVVYVHGRAFGLSVYNFGKYTKVFQKCVFSPSLPPLTHVDLYFLFTFFWLLSDTRT